MHVTEEGFSFTKAIIEDVLGVVFSSELDFFTKFWTVMLIVTFIVEIIYLLLPRVLRVKVDQTDLKQGQSVSISGAVSIVILIAFAGTKMQKFSLDKTFEEKMKETRIEKEFRHR